MGIKADSARSETHGHRDPRGASQKRPEDVHLPAGEDPRRATRTGSTRSTWTTGSISTARRTRPSPTATRSSSWPAGTAGRVGRAMGIINHRYNEHRNEKTARFGYLETYEDQEAFHALLGYIEDWARAKGMTKIVGPYGFSDQDPEGFLIEGFEHRATIATYYNFEWMPRLARGGGLRQGQRLVRLQARRPQGDAGVLQKDLRAGHEARHLRDRRVHASRKEIKPWIRPILVAHERDATWPATSTASPPSTSRRWTTWPSATCPSSIPASSRSSPRTARSWPSSSPCPT